MQSEIAFSLQDPADPETVMGRDSKNIFFLQVHGVRLLEVHPTGEIFVKGNPVENDQQLADTAKEFITVTLDVLKRQGTLS